MIEFMNAAKLDISDDMVIVNVQGDEPFIDPETINKTADIILKIKMHLLVQHVRCSKIMILMIPIM